MRELRSWSDLQLYLRISRRRVRPLENGGVATEIDGQELHLHPIKLSGPWLSIGVVVAPYTALHLRGALAANLELPLGALCRSGDQTLLRQTVPARYFRVEDFERLLGTLIGLAATASMPDDAATSFRFAYAFKSKSAP
jgi:hypothetical protein